MFCGVSRSMVDCFPYVGILFLQQKNQTGPKPFFRARCYCPRQLDSSPHDLRLFPNTDEEILIANLLVSITSRLQGN